MTKPVVLNPPFDHRMLQIGSPLVNRGPKSLRRGRFVHPPKSIDPAVKQRGQVNFLYNPTTIGVTHHVDPMLSSSGNSNSGVDFGELGMNLGTTLGIGNIRVPLLFDRTYEMYSPKGDNAATVLGCYADVLAFYRFTGLVGSNFDREGDILGLTADIVGSIFSAAGGNISAMFEMQYPQHPMFPTLAYVYISGLYSGLKYFGQITDVEVEYTHWTKDMIPVRCAVNVAMELQSELNNSRGQEVEEEEVKHFWDSALPDGVPFWAETDEPFWQDALE